MPLTLRTPKAAAIAVAATVGLGTASVPAPANAYAIDCAILLCLAGGWPSDPVCSAARAEFIRRITPWPIEPPLQIWRCPMGASYTLPSSASPLERLYKAVEPGLSDSVPLGGQSLPVSTPWATIDTSSPPTSFTSTPALAMLMDQPRLPTAARLYLAQAVGSGADIDISDPAFNFVRSIKVYDVDWAQYWQGGDNDICVTYRARVRVGSYGRQGAFSWRNAPFDDLPAWMQSPTTSSRYQCPHRGTIRAVGVEWTDYEGNNGRERVNY